MPEPYLGEIRLLSFVFAPRGWALCNGQLLPINQNQPLFSLLGTTYGGNGQTNFALPNLIGRVPIHVATNHPLGDLGGEETHTVTTAEMPTHTHVAHGSITKGDTPVPTAHVLADSPSGLYVPPGAPVALHPSSVANVGSSQAHENCQPYLALSFCIALVGIFPSPN